MIRGEIRDVQSYKITCLLEADKSCNKNTESFGNVCTIRIKKQTAKLHMQHLENIQCSSTQVLPKGQHDDKQLNGSLLEKRLSQNQVGVMEAQPRGSLKLPSSNVTEIQEFSPAATCNATELNVSENGAKDVVIISQPASIETTKPADKKHKSKLVRRKSLNPRVMSPPGLDVLDNQGMVAIRQQMEKDVQGGCGSPNTYKMWNVNDEQIFFVTEASSCICRWFCGPLRQFSLEVFSSTDDNVLYFHRTCGRCDCCCCLDCFMCLQKLYVVDSIGRTLGAIQQKFSLFNVKFDIVDHDNNILFKVIGPCCPCRCYTEISFKIMNKTGDRQIGRIQKKWGGDRVDMINVDHEYFDVTFPPKLESVDKALILGAAFLINIMYLEMS